MAKQTFTTGQVLTAAQMTSLQQTAMGGGSATAKTASYTLVAADAGATVIMNSASATTITVNTSLFSAGDTVFIQNIGAGISTITAGTATVSTASTLALAQYASGTLYFTAAGVSIFSKADGAAAGGGGKVLQVVSAVTTTATTITGATFNDTSITASITPTLNTSKVLVLISANSYTRRTNSASYITSEARLLRDTTTLFTNMHQYFETNGSSGTFGLWGNIAYSYLDSPATTSSTTYKIQAGDSDNSVTYQQQSRTSTITLLEIGV